MLIVDHQLCIVIALVGGRWSASQLSLQASAVPEASVVPNGRPSECQKAWKCQRIGGSSTNWGNESLSFTVPDTERCCCPNHEKSFRCGPLVIDFFLSLMVYKVYTSSWLTSEPVTLPVWAITIDRLWEDESGDYTSIPFLVNLDLLSPVLSMDLISVPDQIYLAPVKRST